MTTTSSRRARLVLLLVLACAGTLLPFTIADPPAVSVDECVKGCGDTSDACKSPHENDLANCHEMHGCDRTDCEGNPECNFGCDFCDEYWGHYIDACEFELAKCRGACGTF